MNKHSNNDHACGPASTEPCHRSRPTSAAAEALDQLGLVHDADKLCRGLLHHLHMEYARHASEQSASNDNDVSLHDHSERTFRPHKGSHLYLFAEQGAAPPFDHVQGRVNLIGTIDGHVQLWLLVQCRQRNAAGCTRERMRLDRLTIVSRTQSAQTLVPATVHPCCSRDHKTIPARRIVGPLSALIATLLRTHLWPVHTFAPRWARPQCLSALQTPADRRCGPRQRRQWIPCPGPRRGRSSRTPRPCRPPAQARPIIRGRDSEDACTAHAITSATQRKAPAHSRACRLSSSILEAWTTMVRCRA